MSLSDDVKSIVCSDCESPFVESVSNFAAWEYRVLFDRLAEDPTLSSDQRLQEFSRGRALAVSKAMVRAAQKHSVPYDIKRLKCNGQNKILVKVGRIVILQESMNCLFGDRPKAAAYKTEISRYSGVVTQLELNLGDRPLNLLDWSDGILAILLHGASGARFSERDCELGALMLAIPDASYENWILRLDLHDIALFGNQPIDDAKASRQENVQEDRVVVKRKLKKHKTRSHG
ncbi:hypothetical protein [uncultured Agrobacterium sp.]|uniref:hypothetical protein n=1 Tax=uncultured Agrobacterium sp. TaxID=157277 RepID=UPI0025DD6BAF|nr:hypothetical protein [uncultured Agrobacterium sp.]